MRICCVPHCNEKDSKTNRNSFHKLPSDAAMRQKWLEKINRPDFKPPVFTYICSKHFTENDYEIQFGKRSLKKGIVPSILPAKKSKSSEQKKKPLILQRSPKPPKNDDGEETITLSGDDESHSGSENVASYQFVDVTATTNEDESNSARSRIVNFDPARKLRYEGDFVLQDMEDPAKAEQYFHFARKKIVHLSRRAKSVQQTNRRLRKKLLDLKLFVEELNENDMISKQVTLLLQNIIPDKMLARVDEEDDEDDDDEEDEDILLQ